MAAEYAGLLHGQIGHDSVQLFQVIQRMWIKPTEHVVCLISILDFLNLLLRANHSFTADDALHFIQR